MLKITENRIMRSRDRITVTTDDTETVIATDCAVAVDGGYVGIFISTELMLRKTYLRVSTSIINGDQYYPQICVRASIDSNTRWSYTIEKGQELGHLIITEIETISDDEEDMRG